MYNGAVFVCEIFAVRSVMALLSDRSFFLASFLINLNLVRSIKNINSSKIKFFMCPLFPNFVAKKSSPCPSTDKRTDVWSRDFLKWKINSGQWAEGWAGLWKKGVGPIMSNFRGPFFKVFMNKTLIQNLLKNILGFALKSCIE